MTQPASPPTGPEVFPNPPISEALLDVRCRLGAAVSLERLASIQRELGIDYPKRRSRIEARVEHRVEGDQVATQPSSRVIGYQFLSNDERRISQARLDGFTFNLLRPYSDWDSFRSEAWRHWEIYARIAEPVEVHRLALRFINRIDIPLPFQNFLEFVKTAPEVSPDLPQGLAGFVMQLVVPLLARDCTAIVTETIEEPKDDKLPLILDIDVHVERPFPPTATAEIRDTFERLRHAKNDVFFATVTEKAKELFR